MYKEIAGSPYNKACKFVPMPVINVAEDVRRYSINCLKDMAPQG